VISIYAVHSIFLFFFFTNNLGVLITSLWIPTVIGILVFIYGIVAV